MFADNPYKHLRIPVGTNIEHQLDEFWAVILAKTKASVKARARYHLSLKGRVMIENTFMMSLPRYALRCLNMPVKIRDKLNKEYYRLIWNNKIRCTIRDLHSCYPIKKRGVRVIDLHAAVDASVIVIMSRAIRNSESMWLCSREMFLLSTSEKRDRRWCMQELFRTRDSNTLSTNSPIFRSPYIPFGNTEKKVRDQMGMIHFRAPSTTTEFLTTPI